MRQYAIKRLLLAIPTILGAVILVFVMMRIVPGDPVALFIPADTPAGTATQQLEAKIRHEYGFDRPMYVQFAVFMRQMFTGDFGRSFRQDTFVSQDLLQRIPNTLELGLTALIFSTILGIGLGVIAAVRRGSWIDNSAMVGALFGISVPDFWLALMLILFVAVRFPLLPPSGWAPLSSWDGLRHLILPAFVLGIGGAGGLARYTRSCMLEVINDDYIRTARAKGLRERSVILRHALRNALPTIVTLLGLSFGRILSGTVIVETVFGWPGIGRYLIAGISGRDYPVVQATVLIIAISFVLANLFTDLILVYVDPRIRYD